MTDNSNAVTGSVECSCGRAFTHCKGNGCGSKNVYVKKSRSYEETERLGRRVTVYGCRRCMRESTSEQECKAPLRDFNPEFVTASREAKAVMPLWGSVKGGSQEHAAQLAEWVNDHSGKGWNSVRVYIEAQKAGWHLELFGDAVDPDVKNALVEQGLWSSEVKEQEVPMREESQAVATEKPPIQTTGVQEAVSLEDIIKNMQENAK